MPSRGKKKEEEAQVLPMKKEPKPREILYPEFDVRICIGDEALTASICEQFLGWTTDAKEAEELDLGPPLLTDEFGKKVWLKNNIDNRPFYPKLAQKYKQEHLRKKWKLNGETIIISKDARVLNGQHQMVGAVLAEQVRQLKLDRKDFTLEAIWPTEIKFDKIVVLGIDGTDDVVNTMDTCKPRSFSDVVYRSGYFPHMSKEELKAASKMCENCLKMMWYRTHYIEQAFNIKFRTHAEGLEFLNKNMRLVDAIGTILKENTKDKEAGKEAGVKVSKKGSISRYYPAGYASAMLFLMGSSSSDYDEYKNADFDQAVLNWDDWDKATEFWVLLGSRNERVKSVYMALGALEDPESGAGGSMVERTSVVIKGWNAFKEHGEVTDEDVALTYGVDEDDVKHLVEFPNLGGVDLGEPQKKAKVDDEESELPQAVEIDPTPEQLEERKAAIRAENEERQEANNAERKKRVSDIEAKLKRRRKSGKYKTPEEQPVEEAQANGEQVEDPSSTPEIEWPESAAENDSGYGLK